MMIGDIHSMKFTTGGSMKMTSGDKDYRYTVRVSLLREDRPKYWEFNCPNCRTKVCELNGNLLFMSDITHNSTDTGSTNRVRCLGKNCRFWFEFILS